MFCFSNDLVLKSQLLEVTSTFKHQIFNEFNAFYFRSFFFAMDFVKHFVTLLT